MRVLIFGATGMLGHKLYQRLGGNFEVFGTIRSGYERVARFGIFRRETIIESIDAGDPAAVQLAIDMVRPDCVINAIGVVKQVPASKDVIPSLMLNAILPQRLAELSVTHDFRFITISTDCVFDGTKGGYTESDVPDARDLYGLSKLLGEITEGNCLTLRTSIIGRELASRHSILEWFLQNGDRSVKGYTRAVYSGFPTIVLAELIAKIIVEHPTLNGLYHASSDPISKYELLKLFGKHYGKNIGIRPFDEYLIDRSLDSSRFRSLTGFEPAGWDEMVAEMAADPTPYESWL
jgi:dTDP-4-dehydrorhamnose reductase